jgi:hypothetical protein
MKDRSLKPSGTVCAGRLTIPLNTSMGSAFIKDSARFMEGLITEDEFRIRWELDQAEWDAIGDNKELLDRVRDELRQRIENGEAAREAARFAYPEIVKGLVGLAKNEMVSPRHRIEAARELRAVSGVVQEEPMPEHVIININLGGGEVLRYEGAGHRAFPDEGEVVCKPMPHRLTDIIDLDPAEEAKMSWERNDE